MDKRFEKRMKFAANPRLRRHNEKKHHAHQEPCSNVAGFATEVMSDFNRQHGPVAQCAQISNSTSEGQMVPRKWPSRGAAAFAMGNLIAKPVVLAAGFLAATGADVIDAIRKKEDEKQQSILRKISTALRRRYYAADAARREAQRQQIAAIRAAPSSKCPTPTELEDAYVHRRDDDDAKERFGKLMIDLEEHVRRTFVITGNKFTGSKGGVRDWLKNHCPLLAQHYSTCLHYKRLCQDDPDDPTD